MDNNFNYSSSEMLICPSFIHLDLMSDLFYASQIEIGSQSISEYQNGAFTAEISCEMLLDMNINWAIIGHSERRQIFKESDYTVHNKLKNVVKNGINPILCIGETLEQRQSGNTESILKSQMEIAINSLDFTNVNLIIAYEPVWAIGTGMTANNHQIQEMHEFIRELIDKKFGNEIADNMSITILKHDERVKVKIKAHLFSFKNII